LETGLLVTMTTDVGTNDATTLSRMNFSGHVGHSIRDVVSCM